MDFKVKEVNAKSILQKSGLPDADWAANPYLGCRFACKYCYASFVGRFRHPNEEWGSYLDVKINAPILLRQELSKLLKNNKKKNIGTILMSSVIDPYQGLESKYKLTRQCLEVLLDVGYQGEVGILTKSHLVLRDIDLFKKFKNINVGLTVTSTGDPISKYLETYASPHEKRIETLQILHQEGIKTYAFVGPLLPHFVWQEKALEKLVQSINKSGVSFIYLEHLNLASYIKENLLSYLAKDYPEEVERFKKSDSDSYRRELDQMLSKLTEKIGLKVAHGKPIYHRKKSSWQSLKK